MMRYTGFNHLALVTGDMDATIRFWRDLLGLRLVAGMGRRGYRHYFFQLAGQTLITFFEWDGAEPLALKDHGVPVRGPVGFDHVAIGVSCGEDLLDLSARIAAAGIWVSEIMDHGFIHSIYTFDPNRIPIEFSATVDGVDLVGRPRFVDRHPTPAARQGSDPQTGCWPQPENDRLAIDTRAYPGEGLELLLPGEPESP
jgi:catechol 2,3-dioxygenase-like lactoylglutathione lyase family enzyme